MRFTDLRKEGIEHLRGKEIFEIHPVILGGSPTDRSNKAFLSREQHIEAVRYWNRILKARRATQR